MNSNITPRSLVASVRSLTPNRALTAVEARQIAERQANRLLDSTGHGSAPFETATIEELPRILVRVAPSLPGSGMSHWSNGMWHIRLNGSEPLVRRRFTLAHEFKHIIDAPFEDVIYRSLGDASQRAALVEATCDYFAACLLMPRKWVKRVWGDGIQDPAELAWRFDVSSQAMSYRLHQLGLTDPAPRCGGVHLTVQNRRPPSGTYWRNQTMDPVGVAA